MNINDEYIEKHQLIRRYIERSLSAEETIAFEEYILDKPELLETLELESMLSNNVKKVPKTETKLKNSKWFNFSTGLAFFSTCCLLVVIIVNTQGKKMIVANSPNIVYLETVRGQENDFVLTFSSNEAQKLLIVLPNAIDRHRYQVSLLNIDSNKVELASESTLVNDNNELIITLTKEDLSGGNYQLSLTNLKDHTTTYYKGKIVMSKKRGSS